MESLINTVYARDTKRAKLGEIKHYIHRMCSESTFIQVHTDCQKYCLVLQCSSMSPYTNSQNIFLYGISIEWPPDLRTQSMHWFTHRFTHPMLILYFNTVDPGKIKAISEASIPKNEKALCRFWDRFIGTVVCCDTYTCKGSSNTLQLD